MEGPGLRGWLRIKATSGVPCYNRCVIGIGGQHLLPTLLIRVLNHAEQRPILIDPVNGPRRIKNLMSTVLRVGLCEHHQLGIRRVSPQSGKRLCKVINLILCQRQSQVAVGLDQSLSACFYNGH